jgi:hypothetical protein
MQPAWFINSVAYLPEARVRLVTPVSTALVAVVAGAAVVVCVAVVASTSPAPAEPLRDALRSELRL